MKTFVKDLSDTMQLNQDLEKTAENIKNRLPSMGMRQRCRCSYAFAYPIDSFLILMYQLEKLFFESLDISQIRTATFWGSDYHAYHSQINDLIQTPDRYKSGFILTRSSRNNYIEENAFKHLTTAERMFKMDGHHFLKIFTVGNVLVCYTNKNPTFELILKLKMLQWAITKDSIEKEIPEVLELPQAFLDNDTDKVNQLLNKIIDLEIFENIIFNKLKEVFRTDYTRKIEEKKNQLNTQMNDYEYHENTILSIISKIKDLQIELQTLEELSKSKQEDNSDLIKYILKHPHISNVTVTSNSEILLTIDAPILYYDEYLIERIINNFNSEHKAILKAFLDGKYELMVSSILQFNTNTFKITPQMHCSQKTFFGHPHLDRFGCKGNHEDTITEAAMNNNYFGAIEQIIQAVMNLNFADGVVISQMLCDLTAPTRKMNLKTWRSKETGILLTTEEIMEIYNEETKTNE